jgi:hypothetical protein
MPAALGAGSAIRLTAAPVLAVVFYLGQWSAFVRVRLPLCTQDGEPSRAIHETSKPTLHMAKHKIPLTRCPNCPASIRRFGSRFPT